MVILFGYLRLLPCYQLFDGPDMIRSVPQQPPTIFRSGTTEASVAANSSAPTW
jgi:hypothetical protein